MPVFPSTVPQAQNCTSISNQGSLVLIGTLDNCADEPNIVRLTPAAAAVNATSVSVTNNGVTGTTTYLRKGAIIHFGTKKAVVTTETAVAGGAGTTVVPVEPLTTALTATDLADVWGLLRILAPQSIPINEESSTTDISDLTNGLQGSEVVSKLTLNPQIQIVNRFDDRAYNDIISKAARIGGIVYVVFALSDNSHVFGRAIVSGNNREFSQMDVQKPSFNLLMQAPWNSYSPFQYESTANKTLINTARKLSGLDVLV